MHFHCDFFSTLQFNYVTIGACLGRLWTWPPPTPAHLVFPLKAQNNTSIENIEKWDLDHGSICTVLPMLIPPLWAWFMRVLFCISTAWISPQKSSSRAETTETVGPGPSICVFACRQNPPRTLLHNSWQKASHVWVLLAVWRIFILGVDNQPKIFDV